MILGALVDLGADPGQITKQLKSLDIDEFEIKAEKTELNGFAGTMLTVTTGESHHHRQLADITKLISKSKLSDRVKSDSIKVFEKLSEAEAKVHNTTIDRIHFHEVGAMDSIIDVVGTCIALELLEAEEMTFGPLPIGTGTLECAHGTMPVPAPATAELLKGCSIVQTDVPSELVTPTGAAILCSLGEQVVSNRLSVISKAGTGFGSRKLQGRPNMLRATLLTPDCLLPTASCLILETNIDDMIPEIIGSLTDKLLQLGALDVFTCPIQMKKQRPATLLTVLCNPGDREKLLDTIFTESTTFGIREYMTERTCLERKHVEADTPYGKVRVKIGSWKGREITHAPEHDDCVKCAKEHDVPVRTVYDAALKAET